MDATSARALLGVADPTDGPALRRAYRRALLDAHPDRGGSRAELDAVCGAFALLSSGPVPVGAVRPAPAPAPGSAAYRAATTWSAAPTVAPRPAAARARSDFASILRSAIRRAGDVSFLDPVGVPA